MSEEEKKKIELLKEEVSRVSKINDLSGTYVTIDILETILNLITKQQEEIEKYNNMIKERFISKARIKAEITKLRNSMVSGMEENIGLMIQTLNNLLEVENEK